MDHSNALIVTLVSCLVMAFIFGLIAQRLKFSPIVGYLLAGVICGPFTPGFIADVGLALEMAEVGVVLLMFGVGMRFSPRELMEVRGIAIPGALAQIAVATAMGYGLGKWSGFTEIESVLFGLSLSVASTVVLLRTLENRRQLKSEGGRIAVGWLIVEDMAMVFTLVLLPALLEAGGKEHGIFDIMTALALTLGKIALFIGLMMIVGSRILPALLIRIAQEKSRELFTLGTLAIALGMAYAASEWFGASLALGAFLAGLILSNSEISQRATEKSLPLRDIFAVLFFVSVGMLFNPMIILDAPLQVLGVVFTIMVGKSLVALLIVLLSRHPLETGLTIAASLAQIGEFSFILAGFGLNAGLLGQQANCLILAGALISIALNPFFFRFTDWLGPKLRMSPWLNTRLMRLERLPPGAAGL
jgi:CPA2 family monovalent cation:H+ antiporter-2